MPPRLDEITDTVLRSCTGLAAEHGVTVSSTLTPRGVTGDPVLLERLVTNLLHNAIHYNTDGGSVRVEVGEQPALMVTNTGPQVPADAVASLFEPFRRLNRDRTASRDGAGLGLSIVRSVAAAHEGTVDATPNPGGGLRVAVHLPVVEPSDRPPSRPSAVAGTLGP